MIALILSGGAYTQWQALAREAYRDQLESHLGAMTTALLQSGQADMSAAQLVSNWRQQNQPLVERWEALLCELRSAGASDYPMIAVAMRELADLSGNASQP